MIVSISNDFFCTPNQSEAIQFATILSRVQNDLVSVVRSYSDFSKCWYFYIEKGVAFVRTNEELIGEFDKGKQLNKRSN